MLKISNAYELSLLDSSVNILVDKNYNINFCCSNGLNLISKIIFKFSKDNFDKLIIDINYILSENEFICFLENNNNLFEDMSTEKFTKFFINIDSLRFMDLSSYLEFLKNK